MAVAVITVGAMATVAGIIAGGTGMETGIMGMVTGRTGIMAAGIIRMGITTGTTTTGIITLRMPVDIITTIDLQRFLPQQPRACVAGCFFALMC